MLGEKSGKVGHLCCISLVVCNHATFSVCGTRPWEKVKSYNKPDRDGNSDKYLWKSRKKRIVGGTKSDFGEWPWQVSLGKKSDGKNLEVYKIFNKI